MIDDAIVALRFVSALGCGLVAGTFFVFSAFVMNALAAAASLAGAPRY